MDNNIQLRPKTCVNIFYCLVIMLILLVKVNEFLYPDSVIQLKNQELLLQ